MIPSLGPEKLNNVEMRKTVGGTVWSWGLGVQFGGGHVSQEKGVF